MLGIRKVIKATVVGTCIGLASVNVIAKDNYIMAGASPGGLWSLLGAGVDKAMRASYPNATVTYQTSGGGFANAVQVASKKVDFGLMHDAEAKIAAKGTDPYKAPVTNLRAMAVMYNFAAFQPMVTKDFADKYGISSYEDLKAKKAPVRLVLNKRGNIAHNQAVEVLAAYGISLEDIESWGGSIQYSGSKGSVELMKNRQADMVMNNIFVGHSSIREVLNSMPMVMMPVSQAVRDSVSSAMGTGQMVIPGKAYDILSDDHPTLALTAMLVVNSDTSDDEVYKVTKALISNVAEIQGVHKAMRSLNPEMMVKQNAIPFHPGSIKAYKEAGLM
ncbi:TAXI family TRAP transporter solute-binding subunit [Litoricolaceae bacterium]|jgi:TRAP transporter TAXI family solute receptor|nr:TAXI family TRAP transporter solute-binding subunit [Litorivicinaceae bacterium]NCX49144.1 TAXI family TRAP transporter solute-binding subunit [Gammaproteobacteria bacterium]